MSKQDMENSDLALKLYLIVHERDIANSINDFATLRPVFVKILKREPEDRS